MYVALETAAQLAFKDGTRVRTANQYFGWHVEQLEARGVARRSVSEEPIKAYVNHGRWLINCPCGNGVMTHPDWQIAACPECGVLHTRVVFPERLDEVTMYLLARPARANQNWSANEPVDLLRAENAAHGVSK